MNFKFTETIADFNPQQRLYFYECFAHFLTVSMRGILFGEGIPDAERVDRAKWLNEIAHRITAKVFVHQKHHTKWAESDFWEMIKLNLDKNPLVEPDIKRALEWSFSVVRENDSLVDSQTAV